MGTGASAKILSMVLLLPILSLWTLSPAINVLVGRTGYVLTDFLDCGGDEVRGFQFCHERGWLYWFLTQFSLPLFDWLVSNVVFLFIIELFQALFPPPVVLTSDCSRQVVSRSSSASPISAVADILRTFSESLNSISSRMSRLQEGVEVLHYSALQPSAVETVLSPTRLESVALFNGTDLPPATWWVQGTHFGRTPLELCCTIAAELNDRDGLQRLQAKLAAKGRFWAGTVTSNHVYCANENPGCPTTPFAVWLNYGGLYSDSRAHALNLRRFHWAVSKRATDCTGSLCTGSVVQHLLDSIVHSPSQLPSGVAESIRTQRDQPRIVGTSHGFTFIWKPPGWLCPGADVDLVKGSAIPKDVKELGIVSIAELQQVASIVEAPQLQWFLQLCLPTLTVTLDPSCNYGLCSRLDIGAQGVIAVDWGPEEWQKA